MKNLNKEDVDLIKDVIVQKIMHLEQKRDEPGCKRSPACQGHRNHWIERLEQLIGKINGCGDEVVGEEDSEHEKINVQMAIQEICETFGLVGRAGEAIAVLKIKDIGRAFNLRSGVCEPTEKECKRIFDLLVIARCWVSGGARWGFDKLSFDIVDGESVIDMLKKDVIDKDKIDFSLTRMHLMFDDKRGGR